MVDQLPGLATGDDLRAIFVLKSKRFDEQTVSAGNQQSLNLKVQAAEGEGWEILRSNRRSVRLKRKKPDDRQLEDDIWCVLYKDGLQGIK